MSYMVGHFNNSRALENTFMELSYPGEGGHLHIAGDMDVRQVKV